MEAEPSIVEYSGEHEGYKCGYCGSKDTNYSHGMWAHQMTVKDYQDLIDRGWRRSGMYCYKPTMNLTCCPQYAIRCHALEFKLHKSHKKAIKKVNKYLIKGVKPGTRSKAEGSQACEASEEVHEDSNSLLVKERKPSSLVLPCGVMESAQNARGSVNEMTLQTRQAPVSPQERSQSPTVMPLQNECHVRKTKSIPKPGKGPDSSKPKCRKAKEIRTQRRTLKHSDAGDSGFLKQVQTKQTSEKNLEDFLSEPDHAENLAHKLELRLIRSCPLGEAISTEHGVYHKYQTVVHKDPPHKPSQNQYKRFLCDSPLLEKHDESGPPDGYGSFHQHYLLDGKLIAVAVLDILPSCVSSVYLYYDPTYSFLGLGVYSALREIALVRQLHQSALDLKYYYMGFYIHTCPKMRYKGQFSPSYLACPETYEWVPIERCRPKLDVSKYARLSDSGTDKDKDMDVNQVLVLQKGNILRYGLYKLMTSQGADEEEVREYSGLVGSTCAQRMLLVRK